MRSSIVVMGAIQSCFYSQRSSCCNHIFGRPYLDEGKEVGPAAQRERKARKADACPKQPVEESPVLDHEHRRGKHSGGMRLL